MFLVYWLFILYCVLEFSVALPASGGHTELVRLAKSQQILRYLNKTVDPCDNFYEFACGNYAKHRPATEERPGTHVLAYAQEDIQQRITQLLDNREEDFNNSNMDEGDAEVWQKVQNFYKSCQMAQTEKADSYTQKIKNIIAEFGEMPVLVGKKWNAEKFDWLQTVAEIGHKYNMNIIVGFFTFNDPLDNVRNRLHFGNQDFSFRSSATIYADEHEKDRRNIKMSMTANLMTILDLTLPEAIDTANELFNFEIALAKGLGEFSPSIRDPMRRHESVNDLNAMYSYFGLDINRMLGIWLGYMPHNLTDIELIEMNPYYQLQLIHILRDTPKRVIANYIFYKLISRFALPQPKRCHEQTTKYFSKFLSHKIFHLHNLSEPAEYMQTLFQLLKATFRKSLESQKYHWISEETRSRAVEKLQAMQLIIESYDDVDFALEYAQLQPNPYDYIENLKSVYELEADKARHVFADPPKYYTGDTSFAYSPAYVVRDNVIRFPLSNLLPYHLFSTAYPQSINMGVMGFLVGHEIIHGFDDEGRTIDLNGVYDDWWDEDAAEEYKQRTQCFSDQYHQYTYAGHRIPWLAMQSENIADNGGIRLAYATYIKWYEEAMSAGYNMEMEAMPSLEFSNRQLFFVSMAQSWCSDILEESRVSQLHNDEHMPESVRIVGTLSNFPEFSKEFNCPRGSAMNPEEKCEIF